MIPRDYVCGLCGAEGVKLWRKSATSEPVHSQPLLCGDCTEREQGHPLDLSESDQCWGRCPAVPDLRGGWYGYTSVPAEGCAWWSALPLRLTGEWKVRGGVERWMPYSTWTMLKPQPELRRVDWSRDRGMALAFVPDGGRAVTDEELTTLETLAAAATPGAWTFVLWDPRTGLGPSVYAGDRCVVSRGGADDLRAIVAAHEAVPALVAEVRRLQTIEAAHLRLVEAVRANAEAGDDVSWKRVVEMISATADSPLLPVSKLRAALVALTTAEIARDAAELTLMVTGKREDIDKAEGLLDEAMERAMDVLARTGGAR